MSFFFNFLLFSLCRFKFFFFKILQTIPIDDILFKYFHKKKLKLEIFSSYFYF